MSESALSPDRDAEHVQHKTKIFFPREYSGKETRRLGKYLGKISSEVSCIHVLFPAKCYNQSPGLGRPCFSLEKTVFFDLGEQKLFVFAQEDLQVTISRFSRCFLGFCSYYLILKSRMNVRPAPTQHHEEESRLPKRDKASDE